MGFNVQKIGLAVAFSPTAGALLAEACRLAKLFDSQLILMHVGNRNAEEDKKLNELIQTVNLSGVTYKIIWRAGKPATEILHVCREENIDLLVAVTSGIGLGIFAVPYLLRRLGALARSWRESAARERQRRSAQATKAQRRAQDQVRARRG